MSEHMPTDELVAKVRAMAIDLDGDYRNGSWNEGAAKLFDQMIVQVEAAAEQRGAEAAWDEGRTAGNVYEADVQKWHRLRSSRFLDDMPEYPDKPRNPYRADRLEGDHD